MKRLEFCREYGFAGATGFQTAGFDSKILFYHHSQSTLLPFVFALVHLFEHGEPRIFGAREFISLQRVE
jgi:hypothetical protein